MIWASYLAERDLPVSISGDADKVFRAMFPDSEIAKEFSCGRTKATYLIADGLGPALNQSLVLTLKTTNFSMLIDESNKLQHTKYLHILV